MILFWLSGIHACAYADSFRWPLTERYSRLVSQARSIVEFYVNGEPDISLSPRFFDGQRPSLRIAMRVTQLA